MNEPMSRSRFEIRREGLEHFAVHDLSKLNLIEEYENAIKQILGIRFGFR